MTLTHKPPRHGGRPTRLALTPEKVARAKFLLTDVSRLGKPRSLKIIAKLTQLSLKQVRVIQQQYAANIEGDAMDSKSPPVHNERARHDALMRVLMVVGKCTDSFNEVEDKCEHLGKHSYEARHHKPNVRHVTVYVPVSERN